MPNVKQAVGNHNKAVVNRSKPEDREAKCNCSVKKDCPVDGKCRMCGVIYQATVTRKDNKRKETYIGLTADEFKTRWNNHNSSFDNPDPRNSTSLSKYLARLDKDKVKYTLQWKIIDKGKPYSPENKSCNLCVKEKYYILCRPDLATLNHRKELFSACRHRAKHLLCKVK